MGSLRLKGMALQRFLGHNVFIQEASPHGRIARQRSACPRHLTSVTRKQDSLCPRTLVIHNNPLASVFSAILVHLCSLELTEGTKVLAELRATLEGKPS